MREYAQVAADLLNCEPDDLMLIAPVTTWENVLESDDSVKAMFSNAGMFKKYTSRLHEISAEATVPGHEYAFLYHTKYGKMVYFYDVLPFAFIINN